MGPGSAKSLSGEIRLRSGPGLDWCMVSDEKTQAQMKGPGSAVGGPPGHLCLPHYSGKWFWPLLAHGRQHRDSGGGQTATLPAPLTFLLLLNLLNPAAMSGARTHKPQIKLLHHCFGSLSGQHRTLPRETSQAQMITSYLSSRRGMDGKW